MNNQDIQDVDFKELEADQYQQVRTTSKYRVLHVQVEGNPSGEELVKVAQRFTTALNSDAKDVIATGTNVNVFSIAEEGAAPFTGILVRGTLTVEDVARVAHNATEVASCIGTEDGPPIQFHELDESAQAGVVSRVNQVLRALKTQSPNADNVFDATVRSMYINLPQPSEAGLRPVQFWSGSSDVGNPNSWVTGDFLALQKTNVFRYEEEPSKYLYAVDAPYIRYEGPSATWYLDVMEVEVSGVAPIDENDVTKGFQLQWKIKTAVAPTDQAVATAAESLGEHITGDEAAAIRQQASEAVARGEIHLQGADTLAAEDTSLEGENDA